MAMNAINVDSYRYHSWMGTFFYRSQTGMYTAPLATANNFPAHTHIAPLPLTPPVSLMRRVFVNKYIVHIGFIFLGFLCFLSPTFWETLRGIDVEAHAVLIVAWQNNNDAILQWMSNVEAKAPHTSRS